ncbi:hypothetical protein ACEU61_15915, partial [Mycobacterium avium subsp. paratuberculosis]|uniref:hypothetical protein n=1 Tax=Mycobacterium avium TaxID=1764 RepID=UPI0035A637A9
RLGGALAGDEGGAAAGLVAEVDEVADPVFDVEGCDLLLLPHPATDTASAVVAATPAITAREVLIASSSLPGFLATFLATQSGSSSASHSTVLSGSQCRGALLV